MKIFVLFLAILFNTSSWFLGAWIISMLKVGDWFSVPALMTVITLCVFMIYSSLEIYDKVK